MLIRFLEDYQGYLTPGHFYRAGQEVDITDDGRVQALLEAKRAELVEVEQVFDVADDTELDSPNHESDDLVALKARDFERVNNKRKPGRPKRG